MRTSDSLSTHDLSGSRTPTRASADGRLFPTRLCPVGSLGTTQEGPDRGLLGDDPAYDSSVKSVDPQGKQIPHQ